MLQNIVNKGQLFQIGGLTPRSCDSSLNEEDRVDTNKQILKSQNYQSLNIRRGYFEKKTPINSVWRTKAFRILYFVSKFLTQVKQSSDTLKFKMIDRKLFTVIDDVASDYSFYVMKKMLRIKPSTVNYLKVLIQAISSIIPNFIVEKLPVFYPDGHFRIAFDTILVLSVLINIFYIPLYLAFDLYEKNRINRIQSIILDELPSWLLVIEIFLNFNTAFYKEGIIHTRRKLILKNYVRSQFVWDFIIAVPFTIQRIDSSLISYALLFRVTRIKEKFEHIENSLNLREKYSGFLDLGRLVFFVMLVSHFCACFWYYLATQEISAGRDSWLLKLHLDQSEISVQYVNSLYFCTITITTVGYGDITPQTPTEMIFTIIMTLITCGVFGYAINNIGSIFQEMAKKEQTFKNQIARINKHLKRHKVNQTLSLQIRKYFEYYFQKADEDDDEVIQILNHLPMDIKIELQIDKHKKTLLKSKFFRENLSDECVNELCQKVFEVEYQPDDVIFEKNQITKTIFFIASGEVNIVFSKSQTDEVEKGHKSIYQSTKTVIKKFKQGYVLGEKNFLLDREMDYSAQASQQCSTIQIRFEDFMEVLKLYPVDYESFCQMRDILNQELKYRRVISVCEICGYNHGFLKCPFPFYQPNRNKILQRINKSENHVRHDFRRSGKRFLIKDLQQIKICALSVAIDHGWLIEADFTPNQLEGFGIDYNNLFADGDELFESDILTESVVSIISSSQSGLKPSLVINDQNRQADLRKLRRRSAVQLLRNFLERNTQQSMQMEFNENSRVKLSQQKIRRQDSDGDLGLVGSSKQVPSNTEIRVEQNPTSCRFAFEIDQYRKFNIYMPSENIDIVLETLEKSRIKNRVLSNQNISQKKNTLLVNRFMCLVKGVRRGTEEYQDVSKKSL